MGTIAAHPRSRGENRPSEMPVAWAVGSSPLTRGKLERRPRRARRLRLIPAHAGKTTVRSGLWRKTAAHPRSRGENGHCPTVTSTPSGSSPLTRGKRQMLRIGPLRQGLIPAHAGKTLSAYSAGIFPMGSSPLTRGKRSGRDTHHTPLRLIPAHAGKTCKPLTLRSALGAHPRSRGENEIARAEDVNGNGSSPLTRGKPPGTWYHFLVPRLIPAHAGKTTRTCLA